MYMYVCLYMYAYTYMQVYANMYVYAHMYVYDQVLLNLTGRSEHFCPQYNECVMDMKAEMGSSSKAMIRSGILSDKLSNKQKQIL